MLGRALLGRWENSRDVLKVLSQFPSGIDILENYVRRYSKNLLMSRLIAELPKFCR